MDPDILGPTRAGPGAPALEPGRRPRPADRRSVPRLLPDNYRTSSQGPALLGPGKSVRPAARRRRPRRHRAKRSAPLRGLRHDAARTAPASVSLNGRSETDSGFLRPDSAAGPTRPAWGGVGAWPVRDTGTRGRDHHDPRGTDQRDVSRPRWPRSSRRRHRRSSGQQPPDSPLSMSSRQTKDRIWCSSSMVGVGGRDGREVFGDGLVQVSRCSGHPGVHVALGGPHAGHTRRHRAGRRPCGHGPSRSAQGGARRGCG